MPRRVLGLLTAAGVVLVSWVAVSQPGFLAAPAPVGLPQRLRTSVWPGIVPAPEGAAGPYLLRHGGASALFTDNGVQLRLPSRTQPVRELGWSVAGARAVRPQAEQPREARRLQKRGPGGGGEREVPAYGGLRYPGVRPGVDLWFEEHAEGVEYGFRAGRGADLKRVELEYAGAREVRVVEEGRALEVDLEEGVLREEGLHCAQEGADGTSREVACRFTDAHPVGLERWAYAIEVDVEDPERPVVVDPVIRWTNYLGGARNDEFGGMAVTDAGEIFVVGTLLPLDLETDENITIDGLPLLDTGKAVVIASFHEDGGFRNWRALHGGGEDFARAVTIGEDGMVYVAGETNSNVFPNLGYCLNHGAGSPSNKDAFVAQFDPVTFKFRGVFLVGTPEGDEIAHGITAGADGGLFLVGQTTSPAFPNDTIPTPDGGWDGGQDAFVMRLLPSPRLAEDAGFMCPGPQTATVVWSIVGRGTHDDVAYAVTVDEGGKVYVAGKSASPTRMLPAATLTRAHSGPAGTNDVFVARVNPGTGGVEKSLYLGAQGNDEGRALALKGTSLFVGGTTHSAGFPLETAPGVSVSNAFVVTLERGSFALQGTSLLGGLEGNDEGLALAIDRSSAAAGRNFVYLGGRTTSRNDFPLVDAFDRTFGVGPSEGFVARVEVGASAASWSSLVGGEAEDAVLALNSERPGRLLVGGLTHSPDLAGVPDGGKGPAGGSDLFLMSVDTNAPTQDAGTDAGEDGGKDAGEDGGKDAGEDGKDAGEDGKDAGEDGGTDGGTPVLMSPLGWSCGASGTRGGPGVLTLGTLAGLALLACRRKRVGRSG